MELFDIEQMGEITGCIYGRRLSRKEAEHFIRTLIDALTKQLNSNHNDPNEARATRKHIESIRMVPHRSSF